MGRRPRAAATAPAEETTTPAAAAEETPTAAGAAATGDTPIKRRRRRRTVTAPDYATETQTLVEAVLKGRGAKGATPEVLGKVVGWARGVRAEAETLRELASRPRRQKTQAPAERISTNEMNRALLDGILSGAVAIDVQDDGSLVFLSADAVRAAAAPVASEASTETAE